jgi:hypothetical protein
VGYHSSLFLYMPLGRSVRDELDFEQSPSTNTGATSFQRVGRARNSKILDETQLAWLGIVVRACDADDTVESEKKQHQQWQEYYPALGIQHPVVANSIMERGEQLLSLIRELQPPPTCQHGLTIVLTGASR